MTTQEARRLGTLATLDRKTNPWDQFTPALPSAPALARRRPTRKQQDAAHLAEIRAALAAKDGGK